jgi:hypothetical protein
MRRTIIALAAALTLAAVLPTAASAASLHRYRVHDAGAVIVHRVTVCLGGSSGFETLVRFAVRVEDENGDDLHVGRDRTWVREGGCTRIRWDQDDNLDHEGPYFARVRARIPGYWSQRTSWHTFWSS